MIYLRSDMRYVRMANLEWHNRIAYIEGRRAAVYNDMLGPGSQGSHRAGARWRDPITAEFP
jgi:hypothetical protein